MHTYVWTGTTSDPATANRLIVWGGEGQRGSSRTGASTIPRPTAGRR
jgi:hypothetical protein